MLDKTYKAWKKELVQACNAHKTPLNIQFELTGRCNLDCKMCYVHNQDSNKLKDQELSTEQWKAIMDDAYNNGMMFATLTGGECLLRDDFKELYLHLYNKGVIVAVLSNGTMMDDDMVMFLKDHKPEAVRISIYGSTEESYRNVTGHFGRDRAMNAVLKLKNAGVNVQANVTGSSYIAPDYINTLKFIQSNGVRPVFAELYLFPKRYDPTDDSHYISMDDTVKLSATRQKLVGRECLPVDSVPEAGGNSSNAQTYGLKCNAGNSHAAISWRGEMYPCSCLYECGGVSLLENKFDDAWKMVVEKASKILQPVECEGCPYDKVCPKCIAIRTSSLYSGHCNPDICELTKRLVAAGVKKLDTPQEADEDEFEH